METIQKLRSLELYLAAHPDCEENSECAGRLSDVQELLKEITDPTAQQKADKAELLEVLEIVVELQKINYGSGTQTHLAMISTAKEIKAIIEKHKQ